jgi:hypothetical protein
MEPSAVRATEFHQAAAVDSIGGSTFASPKSRTFTPPREQNVAGLQVAVDDALRCAALSASRSDGQCERLGKRHRPAQTLALDTTAR